MGYLMPISLKNRYPFRLATTSFIHPAGYTVNVKRLAPLVDEIELLFLERDNLPALHTVNALRELAAALDVTYNIHLPMDISLADPSPSIRKRSRNDILKALERVAPLNASTHTLHVAFHHTVIHPNTVQAWQERAVESLSRLLVSVPVPVRRLSVETLNFPPVWLAPVVFQLDLPMCIDVGHIIRYGFDLQETLSLFERRIDIFHLHGVDGTQDHCSLSFLSSESRDILTPCLNDFRGSVSLEVFSYEKLTDSLDCFGRMMAPDSE